MTKKKSMCWVIFHQTPQRQLTGRATISLFQCQLCCTFISLITVTTSNSHFVTCTTHSCHSSLAVKMRFSEQISCAIFPLKQSFRHSRFKIYHPFSSVCASAVSKNPEQIIRNVHSILRKPKFKNPVMQFTLICFSSAEKNKTKHIVL